MGEETKHEFIDTEEGVVLVTDGTYSPRPATEMELQLRAEVEQLRAERQRWISDYTGATDPHKILSDLYVAERERDEARERLNGAHKNERGESDEDSD